MTVYRLSTDTDRTYCLANVVRLPKIWCVIICVKQINKYCRFKLQKCHLCSLKGKKCNIHNALDWINLCQFSSAVKLKVKDQTPVLSCPICCGFVVTTSCTAKCTTNWTSERITMSRSKSTISAKPSHNHCRREGNRHLCEWRTVRQTDKHGAANTVYGRSIATTSTSYVGRLFIFNYQSRYYCYTTIRHGNMRLWQASQAYAQLT